VKPGSGSVGERRPVRTLDVLVDAALRAVDQDCRWDLVGSIVKECPDDVLELSLVLLRGATERERTLAADILGRLVGVEPGARGAIIPALLDSLSDEKADGTTASIVAALGHMGDPSVTERLVAFSRHHCAEVRLAVAFAVATAASDTDSPSPAARAVLIRLSQDDESEVRDWATFGLGTLSAADGPDVRAALLARTEDANRDTRAEALFGLAVRHDPRAVPQLIRDLQSSQVGSLVVEAAAAAADPRLLPALLALQYSGEGDPGKVRKAIDRCSGRDRPVPVS
jgi:HEAT repeat protein